MLKFRRFGVFSAIMVAGFIICGEQGAFAQQDKNAQPMSREQRIQEHQERIRKILEESNRRRQEAQQKLQDQQQANPPAAPGQNPAPAAGTPNAQPAQPNAAGQTPAPGQPQAQLPVGLQPGQPLPTGPVQARMTPPIQQATPTPAAAAPQTARSESRTILFFHPLDSIVNVRDRFKTDVVAETKDGEIDEISVLLRYPRHVLNPLALDHTAIDPFVKDHVDYEFNPDEGTIYFHAKLEKPTRFTQAKVLSLVWEALEESDGATISYQFGTGAQTTGLYYKGSDLLGTLPGSQDGVIKTTVQVVAPRGKPTITKLENNDIMIGARPPAVQDDRPNEKLALHMRGPNRAVRPNETFDVGVYLDNPGEKRIDRIRLYLQFDPEVVQVVDYDTGNIVTRGTNIHDAMAREAFPFDFYRYNEADNKKGTIVYEVSASTSHVRGSGRVATIRLKALKDTPGADLVMVENAKGLAPTTGVSFAGISLLQDINETDVAKAVEGVSVPVKGPAIADKAEREKDIYNPFQSNLARRMQAQDK